MHCSIKAALDSYIDQLRAVLTGNSKSRYGTYHVSEIAIPSKPNRSQKGSRSRRGKAPVGVDGALQMPQHFWEIDARDQMRKQEESETGGGKGDSMKLKKSSYSTTIDIRYSPAANAAAHAVLGAYPKTVYSAGVRL